jgi:hypothetical protein
MADPVKTRNVFLDTECFDAGGFNYSSKPFKILGSLATSGEVQVYVTEVTLREVKAHISEAVTEAVRLHKRFGREARILRNSKLKTATQVLLPPDRTTIEAELIAQFERYLKEAQSTVLHTDNMKAGPVLESYFQSKPPFGAGQKKSEFPDAFALAAVREWCSKNKQEIYVVSGDSDMQSACDENGPLYALQKLSDFLNLLASDDKALSSFLRAEIGKREQEIEKRIGEMFESELGFILEDQDGDVDEVSVSGVSLDEVEILQTEEDYADLQVEATIEFDAYLTYVDQDNSVWDSEDKRFMFTEYAHETVRRKESLPVDISVTFEGLDPDSFNIVQISFTDTKKPVLVNADEGDGWPYK